MIVLIYYIRLILFIKIRGVLQTIVYSPVRSLAVNKRFYKCITNLLLIFRQSRVWLLNGYRIYVDILPWENLSSIELANLNPIYWSVRLYKGEEGVG